MALTAPVLVLLMIGTFEFGTLFYVRNSMMQVAGDVTRDLATGRMTQAEAETAVGQRLTWNGATFTMTYSEPATDQIQVLITVSIADVTVVNFFPFEAGKLLSAQTTMRKQDLSSL